jgi:hypothetical protein
MFDFGKSSTRARIVENPLIRVWEAAFGKKRGRSDALANSYRSGNLWICSMIERYSSRKSAALDSN